MDVWSLKKSADLRTVLLLLQSQLGQQSFAADTCTACSEDAIWLAGTEPPFARAYLYTLGQEKGRYGVHLEYPQEIAPLYDVFENLRLSSLTGILAVHFDVACVVPLPQQSG